MTVEIVDKAFSQIVNTNLPLYVAECEALSITQLNLLIAIAKGESILTGATTMSKYKLGTPQNVSKNKIVLEQKDILDKRWKVFIFLILYSNSGLRVNTWMDNEYLPYRKNFGDFVSRRDRQHDYSEYREIGKVPQ